MSEKLRLTLKADAHLGAPADRVYAVIADYHKGHPAIVPKQFSNMQIVKGGVGAGTEITFDVTVFGMTEHFRAVVTEPERGRTLVESNIEPRPSVTTFLVEPAADGGSNVTITTDMTMDYGGVLGAIQAFIIRRTLPSMYAEELRRLARVAASTV